ncbi:MAG: ATP phosphoribosyltransferase regulatory subunit [Pseudomonadota bacterium]
MAAARAYLTGGRVGNQLDRLSALRSEISNRFEAAGAVRVEPETLQPADLLLDLYGEDINARAFRVEDPAVGSLFLRPDFTVPVARVHMEDGADPARYYYDGLVWRRQAPDADRATEYLQAGIELIGGADAEADEAEVFQVIGEALGARADQVVTGDIGIVTAAIEALPTSDARKSALRRHIWRPARFQQLLDRYSKPVEEPTGDAGAWSERIQEVGKFVGSRSRQEILDRLNLLKSHENEAPIASASLAMIRSVLSIRASANKALSELSSMKVQALSEALERMSRRLEKLREAGVDTAKLRFDASFGRALEYYDGFVFEFRAADPALPALGGGGRYDALTATLGKGRGSAAVGGMIRPEAMLAAEGGA